MKKSEVLKAAIGILDGVQLGIPVDTKEIKKLKAELNEMIYDYEKLSYCECTECHYKSEPETMRKLMMAITNNLGYMLIEDDKVKESRCPRCKQPTLQLKRVR